MEFFLTTVLKLLPFLRVTILIAFTSMALGLIFGTLLAAMKLCRIKIFKTIANLFTTFIRCTPVIVLIFLAYYGLPVLFGLAGIDINGVSKIVFSIIALTMYASGTLSEIIRPAYLSVDKGQMEASRSLGLSYAKSMRLVILPQAIRTMVPSIINQFIITLKDTSILSVIGFPELTNMGKTIAGNTFKSLQTWAIVGIMYMIVIVALSKLAKRIERRIDRGR